MSAKTTADETHAVIGAGPAGPAAMRALRPEGVSCDGYEACAAVGGPWVDCDPRSTVDESAHLGSSHTTTPFAAFPMTTTVDDADCRTVHTCFRAHADRFGPRERLRFGARVTPPERGERGGWMLSAGFGGIGGAGDVGGASDVGGVGEAAADAARPAVTGGYRRVGSGTPIVPRERPRPPARRARTPRPARRPRRSRVRAVNADGVRTRGRIRPRTGGGARLFHTDRGERR